MLDRADDNSEAAKTGCATLCRGGSGWLGGLTPPRSRYSPK